MDQSQVMPQHPQRPWTLKPGDLVEIFRYTFQHWAVYVGDGYVVHVTPPPGVVPGAVSSFLRSAPTKKAMVMKQKLQEVVGDSPCRINNILDEEYKPRTRRIIVKEALMQVGKVIDYSVFRKNCEHFATKMRYGIAVSIQVIDALAAATIWPFRLPLTTAVELFGRRETD